MQRSTSGQILDIFKCFRYNCIILEIGRVALIFEFVMLGCNPTLSVHLPHYVNKQRVLVSFSYLCLRYVQLKKSKSSLNQLPGITVQFVLVFKRCSIDNLCAQRQVVSFVNEIKICIIEEMYQLKLLRGIHLIQRLGAW